MGQKIPKIEDGLFSVSVIRLKYQPRGCLPSQRCMFDREQGLKYNDIKLEANGFVGVCLFLRSL